MSRAIGKINQKSREELGLIYRATGPQPFLQDSCLTDLLATYPDAEVAIIHEKISSGHATNPSFSYRLSVYVDFQDPLFQNRLLDIPHKRRRT